MSGMTLLESSWHDNLLGVLKSSGIKQQKCCISCHDLKGIVPLTGATLVAVLMHM